MRSHKHSQSLCLRIYLTLYLCSINVRINLFRCLFVSFISLFSFSLFIFFLPSTFSPLYLFLFLTKSNLRAGYSGNW